MPCIFRIICHCLWDRLREQRRFAARYITMKTNFNNGAIRLQVTASTTSSYASSMSGCNGRNFFFVKMNREPDGSAAKFGSKYSCGGRREYAWPHTDEWLRGLRGRVQRAHRNATQATIWVLLYDGAAWFVGTRADRDHKLPRLDASLGGAPKHLKLCGSLRVFVGSRRTSRSVGRV